MTEYKTEQEIFWTSEFGDHYKQRNRGPNLIARKTAFFTRALKNAAGTQSICEFGCNIGLNLAAMASLDRFELTGIEINAGAAHEAKELGVAHIEVGSVLNDLSGVGMFDLTLTMGVLIHINPDHLNAVYENLVKLSRRYILIAEYYNPSPVTVSYRGHENRLFKRDFAGEIMAGYGFELVDYGFVYHRDNIMPMDDFTWFLMQRVVAQ